MDDQLDSSAEIMSTATRSFADPGDKDATPTQHTLEVVFFLFRDNRTPISVPFCFSN
jgi:hypothetical protein